MSTATDMKAIAAALAEPFDPREVKWKPAMVKQNRCLAMAYIDARLIQDRLDDVLGVGNWSDDYELLPDGSVMCTLRVFLAGRWVKKVDVGSTSEQPDSGDRMKAAFSDALKRAAVKFGIGRYLYRLPSTWVDYDPVKKQIIQPPQMPAFAIPGGKAQAPKQPTGGTGRMSGTTIHRPEALAAREGGERAHPQTAAPTAGATAATGAPATNSSPASPKAAPATSADPLTDREALNRLLALKGKAWSAALVWLGDKTGERYDPNVVDWLAIPECDRLTLVKAVRGMPDAPVEQKASA